MFPRLQIDATWSDFAAAFGATFFKNNQAETKAKELIRKRSGNRDNVIGLSVRTLFDALLQVLNLPKGSEILMSAATIKNMVDIVEAHGLFAVPIDLDIESLAPKLEQAEKFVNQRSKLFLIAPLFGGKINLEPYAEFCRKHHLLLIEDIAQAYSKDYCGSPLADYCLLSFGPIKKATAFGGGILHTNHLSHTEIIEDILNAYPQLPIKWYQKRVMKIAFLKMLSYPIVYKLLVKLIGLISDDLDAYLGKVARGFKGELIEAIRKKPPAALFSVIQRRLMEDRPISKHAEQIKRALNKIIKLPGSRTMGTGEWVFPIMVENRQRLMKQLRVNGFDATVGATSMIAISDERLGSSKNAKEILANILYVPHRLPDQRTVNYLAELINQHS